MTQQELEILPPGTVLRVVVEPSTVCSPLFSHKTIETMFVVVRGRIADWAIYAWPLELLTKHWDSEYFTMIEAVKNMGIKVIDSQLIKSISGCDEEMYKTYRY